MRASDMEEMLECAKSAEERKAVICRGADDAESMRLYKLVRKRRDGRRYRMNHPSERKEEAYKMRQAERRKKTAEERARTPKEYEALLPPQPERTAEQRSIYTKVMNRSAKERERAKAEGPQTAPRAEGGNPVRLQQVLKALVRAERKVRSANGGEKGGLCLFAARGDEDMVCDKPRKTYVSYYQDDLSNLKAI